MSRKYRSNLFCQLVLAAGFLALQSHAASVVVQFKNGDRMSGELLAQETNHVVVRTGWGAQLSLPISSLSSLVIDSQKKILPSPAVTNVPSVATAKRVVPPAPPSHIRTSVQFGSDLLFGAKDRQLVYGRLKSTYDRPYTRDPTRSFRAYLEYMADYGETAGVQSANRMTGSMKTDFDLSHRTYCYNVGSGGYDDVRKIDLHYEVGPGLGYHLLTNSVFKLSAEGGANYQVQRRSAGGNLDSLFMRAAQEVMWKFSPRLSLAERFEFFSNAEEFSQYRFKFDSTFSCKLTESLSLNLTVLDIYDTDPAPNVNKNELQIRSSIGITF